MEKYCPKSECYYHGYETTCPEHGIKTKECKKGTYKPEPGYTLKELGRPRNWKGHV